MSLNDLDSILNKEAIIATYPAAHLRSNPEQVEQMYRAHAMTHIPLGDTSRYVDTIFKWVGGQNKGAFIGAVVGDYGHGKTSFQVHVWEESTERKVFAVPPFSWKKVSDMIEGTAAWVEYMLKKNNPDQARSARKIYDNYREKSLRETAEKIAQEKGQDIEDVLKTLEAAIAQGTTIRMETNPERYLDYCEELTVVIKEAGYAGLLMLLDEPEVAAKELGFAAVSQILFEIANGLLQRQGDFGVFVSMPENFLASAQRTFGALPARLQARNCMSRLRDIYGSDFAEQLWSCYVDSFDLGSEGEKVVFPITLMAIGQVASSDRKDLSYGPRTVVSTFGQMVHRYKETKATYEVEDFVNDCLEDEILVSPDYPSRIMESLNRPEASKLDKRLLKMLAAFPNGISNEQAEELGIKSSFLDQARSGGVVYRAHGLYGLAALRKKEGEIDEKEPDQTIEEIFSEFAPSPKSFQTAKVAFIEYVLPLIFESRSGHQLLGWDMSNKWVERKGGVKVAEFVGAFKETVRDYPRRRVAVAVGPTSEVVRAEEFRDSDAQIDILIHFALHWNIEESLPDQLIEVSAGDPKKNEPGIIRITIDLASEPIPNDQLENIIDSSYLTPLGILYLIGEMDRRTFPKDVEGIWGAIRKPMLRNLPVRFFQGDVVRAQAAEQVNRMIPSGAIELVPSLCDYIFKERYPEYSTVIRQPKWESKVKDYILCLQNPNIPLSCKRGRVAWEAPKNAVANVFNTNVMNLSDFFSGYENLIYINMGKSRDDPAVVEFKLHPLEEKIMDNIMAEKPAGKLKIDGKECWWMDFGELMPLILYSGYQIEEIIQIVEMGKARGTIYAMQYKGSPILYCKPLDPEQMKTQLRDKLESLKEETEELKKLPDYRYDFNFDEVEKKIEALQDDADFESIKSQIHRTFEQNHDRLEGFFDHLEEQLEAESTISQKSEVNLNNSRQVSGLKTPPTASSKWCSDLNTYIVANLSATVEDIKKECTNIRQKVNRAISEFAANRKGNPLEKIKRLQDGWSAHSTLNGQVKSVQADVQQLFKHFDDYDQWRKLLARSDDLHKQLMEMKKDESHRTKANEFVGETEKVWDDISDLLRTRNVSGLGSYRQYFKQLDEIDTDRKKYLQELKGAFEKIKDQVNTFLTDVGLGAEGRVNVVFNPDDSKGCYSQLYKQALDQLMRIGKAESEDLSSKRLELLYASNVLGRVSNEEVSPVLGELEQCETSLKRILISLTAEWIEEVIKKEEQPKPKESEVKEVITKTRDSLKEARRIIIEKTRPGKEEEVSKEAGEMLKLIPDKETVDLKQLVLKMMKKDQPPADILEPALKYLSELFKKDKVQIKVELPRR